MKCIVGILCKQILGTFNKAPQSTKCNVSISKIPPLLNLYLHLAFYHCFFNWHTKDARFSSNYTSDWTPGPPLSCLLWVWIKSLLFSFHKCAPLSQVPRRCYYPSCCIVGSLGPAVPRALLFQLPPSSVFRPPFQLYPEQMMTNRALVFWECSIQNSYQRFKGTCWKVQLKPVCWNVTQHPVCAL